MNLLRNLFLNSNLNHNSRIKHFSVIPYSWILTNQLAIGPIPRIPEHWEQLKQAGFRGRFSCCYSYEEVFAPIPADWQSERASLPDHRNQEKLDQDHLHRALQSAEDLLSCGGSPLYVHCFAGIERSSLIAIGLTARLKKIDLFTALAWVRQCHPNAMPIYEHLEIMDSLLKLYPQSGKTETI